MIQLKNLLDFKIVLIKKDKLSAHFELQKKKRIFSLYFKENLPRKDFKARGEIHFKHFQELELLYSKNKDLH